MPRDLLLLVHLLAATIWTGGHLVLALTILPTAFRRRSVEELLRFESAYEKVGIPALLVQVVSGVWLARLLVPDPRLWFALDHPVGRLVGLKLTLLAATAALAIDARLRLIPRLGAEHLGALAWHVVPVTLLSVAFVVLGLAFRTGWFF
jgi:putative copper export protein